MSSGRIWLKSESAPSSLALSEICLMAVFLCGGVPFLILSSSFMILRSRISSGGSCSSSTSSKSFPKYCWSSGLMNGRDPMRSYGHRHVLLRSALQCSADTSY